MSQNNDSSEKNIEVRAVNMAHEMYNDGLYLLEQNVTFQNYGDKQRNYRFAIVSFSSSFEAYLNAILRAKIKLNPNIVSNGSNISVFLDKGFNSGINLPEELQSINKKVDLLEKLFNINGKIINSIELKKFKNQVIKYRNGIVHYGHGNFSTIYSLDIEGSAKVAPQLLRDLIQLIHQEIISANNTQDLKISFPSYLNQSKYKSIE